MKVVVPAFNQEKGLLRDYEPSDGPFLKHYCGGSSCAAAEVMSMSMAGYRIKEGAASFPEPNNVLRRFVQ